MGTQPQSSRDLDNLSNSRSLSPGPFVKLRPAPAGPQPSSAYCMGRNFGCAYGRGAVARGAADRAARADRARAAAGQDAVRRAAAAARDRAGAGAPAAAGLPQRADHRPGPAAPEQPILYLALFGPLLTRLPADILGTADNAYKFFVPGLLIQLGLFGSTFVGFAIISDWRAGTMGGAYGSTVRHYRGRGRAPGMKARGLITSSSRRRARNGAESTLPSVAVSTCLARSRASSSRASSSRA